MRKEFHVPKLSGSLITQQQQQQEKDGKKER
jgi:hypothetical protein